MAAERIVPCVNTLKSWGFRVKIGKTVGGVSSNYFSGTDEERLEDLQEMLDDEDLSAILCGRGGYGLSRIIDQVSFKKFRKSPKWILGYSDICLLHAHIYSNFNIASLHAPMAAAFNEIDESEEYINSIYNSLTGIRQSYTISAGKLNRNGNCKGELVGGNLSLLVHVIGSRSDIDTKNKILFIEDLGEYKYNIDRMLMQLKRAGKLDNLAGLIVGSFSEIKDTTISFGQEPSDLILDKVKEYNYPVCFDFPVGHVKENYALKIGVNYDLTISARHVILEEGV